MLLLVLPAMTPVPGVAQEKEGWDSERALELIGRARAVRHEAVTDSSLLSYSADARGYVYFYVHREDTGERIPVRTDQIALEVYWKAPNRTRQRIVGLRDDETLPTNIRYHLDHLTVVQDDFDDRIRLGDGDEVSSVVHPAAPGSESVYEFRLADSLSLILPGPGEPVRVYRVQVRPRDLDGPGFVGSVFVDRATGAIVRMSFTFTPASYVDDYLDYIRISLDNMLWEGRHWLPYRQQVEIRRELPVLDFPAGTVIRGRYEIGDYVFNPDLPDGLFEGPAVTALPESRRRAFPFEEDLYAQMDEEGLVPLTEMDEIREEAGQVVGERYLSGLRRYRLHVPSVSSVLRYDRAEGLYAGAGFYLAPRPWLELRALGGYAFGREKPSASLEIGGGERFPGTRIRGSWNDLRDVGPVPAISGAMNTLSTLLLDDDHLDPWFASGVELSHRVEIGDDITGEVGVRWERHRSARNVVSDDPATADLRPVRPAEEGDLFAIETAIRMGDAGPGFSGAFHRTDGRFEGRGFSRSLAWLTWSRRWLSRALEVEAELRGGLADDDAPPQSLFLLGGRETLPGHPYRAFVGDWFWLASGEASRGIVTPWARVRALAGVGGTGLGSRPVPPGWEDARPQPSPRGSVGLGLGLFWDILHVDLARGLGGGGRWEPILSVTHRFRGIL